MSPHPSPSTAPASGPRHAAQPATRARSGSASHYRPATPDASSGRHRRPESLADTTILRAVPAQRVAGGRRSTLELTPRRAHADRSRSHAERNSRAHADRAEEDQPITRSERRRRANAAPAQWSPPTGGTPRGKHARAADQLAITVRPLPAVRDAAGVVRDWALADSGKRPATGSHRAPGTLPIESWLLVGRRRQQALLAAVVAVGMLLIVPPLQQSDSTDVNPVNAAGQLPATASSAPVAKPGKNPNPSKSPDRPGATSAPIASTPAKPGGKPAKPAATPPSREPQVLVPKGDGPANSLRTTGSAAVALTFDDGPDPVQTPRILALLAENQVKATFCVVGEQARRHPEIIRQIAEAGHTLCNHSWNHSLTLGKDKPARIQADLRRTNEAIRAAAPDARIPFFRAPGGNFTDALVETAYADGMTSLYWEVDPRDWDQPQDEDDAAHVEKIVKSVKEEIRPGAIVLSHDYDQPTTIAAYEKLLPWLTENFALDIPNEPPAPAPAHPAAGASPATGE
jgi:peptidoglycan/xylan/chitin deacetylase (PgdA/CDA1 family)